MTGFGIDNLPYGVFSVPRGERRLGVRLGNDVVDLSGLGGLFAAPSLNPLMAAGRREWTAAREAVIDHVMAGPPTIPLHDVTLHLPFEVADYTDFYSSEAHAVNTARILRPSSPELPPQWRHLPIGYHGRSSTVVVSGTPIRRPSGQLDSGVYGPTRRLDIEAEVGFVVGVPGRLIPTGSFEDHVFGVVLVNDWSARDIQAWEYRPLGPFLGKSFATSVSPWVVPLSVLTPVAPPRQDPQPLDYLRPAGPAYDLRLSISWNETPVSSPPFATMYWTAAQQLAHLTSNGASVRTGDLYASGTVSGPERGQVGSFLELTSNGAAPVTLADGSRRGYLRDGDRVEISGSSADGKIALGSVLGTVAG
ncbi:fumarylacetoacetase [Paractinoplanes deccanensis]|uniref:fumarylacetoacetase n=1 Tax=Paractinoplanes deccanensis TaxID=113561 RepID=A0ABQ3YDE9_9ACTN|nr:fumarylacetoacetate hydrolase family protein [Actinoplanes deccanensis]GID78034.1 fumarylacetoacetase [Actinoplanes deccanensis]